MRVVSIISSTSCQKSEFPEMKYCSYKWYTIILSVRTILPEGQNATPPIHRTLCVCVSTASSCWEKKICLFFNGFLSCMITQHVHTMESLEKGLLTGTTCWQRWRFRQMNFSVIRLRSNNSIDPGMQSTPPAACFISVLFSSSKSVPLNLYSSS